MTQPVEGPRLLLVEDDDGDALIIEELLVDSGEPFQTDRVTSIAAAVPLLHKVDCALVDLGLPDADGLLRCSSCGRTIPTSPSWC